ncbi:filamentous hemagglutinin N-terminal domain-containing protein, partial [uncultured Massilia sp.]|uniref:two-partner secretion domain-containing protein n=1 Tax=uncultured Massilia sp. TaxID=169973 RepID=UPI0025E9C701
MTTTSPRASVRTLARKLGALLLAASHLGAQAAPTLPQVVAGQASFSQQGNVFSITNTPGTIINWQRFDVGAGEITRFIQQNSDSAVLNRVLGQDPSRILGALQSNGKVFLINPNGILFGQGARVDVNGLVASTLDIANADFLAGRKVFQGAASAGAVRNDGTIATPSGGRVYLVAPDVENRGIVSAPNGDVVLAAGHRVQLVDAGDPDLHVVLSAPADRAVNLGQVIAQGGRIGIYGALVNQRGLVSADSAVRGAGGRIVLKASGSTVLEAGSVTSAAGSGGADGGAIHLLGAQVRLDGDARVDASGAAGGTVLAGGDWQGGGATVRAQQTVLAADASIRADGLGGQGGSGNGGKVVLWSDGATTARGSISARGNGAGAGGMVETSGHDLDAAGLRVDARGGAAGKAGTWLLDPHDIEVTAGGTAAAGDVATPGAGASGGVTRIAPATLVASGADVVLQARHDLTISSALDAKGSVRAQAGNDIHVDAAVTSRDGDLDFRAGHAFTLGANGALRSDNYIDIGADRMTLDGAVGTAGVQAPVLTLTSSDASRPIVVGSGSGSGNAGSLWLDAASLGRLSAGAYEINLGNSRHLAPLRIDAALNLSSHLVLDNAGAILIDAPVDLGSAPGSRFVANLYGAENLIDVGAPLRASASVLLQGDRIRIGDTVTVLDGGVTLRPASTATAIAVGGADEQPGFAIGTAALERIRAGTLTIGGLEGASGGLTIAGAADLSGIRGAPERIVLDAGAGALQVDALLAVPATLVLQSTSTIADGAGGALVAGALAVRGGDVALDGQHGIGTLAGSSAGGFQVAARTGLTVGNVDGIDGVTAANGTVRLDTTGSLALNADVRGLAASLSAAGIGGGGTVRASTVTLRSSAGIGATTSPLHTAASTLSAWNAGSGTRPINIANQGALVLASAVQEGADNGGAITVDSVGGLTVPAYVADTGAGVAGGDVRTGSGDISLAAHSPLTIEGRVTTDSGNVRLEAGNGGTLTIAAGALVKSQSGNVDLVAGATQIAANSISVSSPDKLHLPASALASCIANPDGAGCAQVLAQAVQACVADPSQSFCSAVLPTIAQCVAEPTRAGCQVVLPTIAQCVAEPTRTGCQAVLPTLAQCVAEPTRTGCQAVLPTIAQCVAEPTRAGCQAVLPTIAQCVAEPTRTGCQAVLPTIAQCVAEPTRTGCQAVLPTIAQCVAEPTRAGCQAVLPTIAQCVAEPTRTGCQAVLPTLAQCVAEPTRTGCQAVLPTLAQCVSEPTRAGCQAVLPTTAQCVAEPTRAGCQAVLPTIAQCIAEPTRAGCQAVLPTLAQCVAEPTRTGCQAVLPTLAQFVAEPTRAGCQAVLPTIAQCVAEPTRAGCQAVLPTLAQCVAEPARAG